MSALKYWVWLSSCTGVSSIEKTELLKVFKTPENIYRADKTEILSSCKISRYGITQLENKSMDCVEKILEACVDYNINIMTLQDSQYPERLTQIYDPPIVVYIKGRLPIIDDYPTVALVGTRKCTLYAQSCAEKLGSEIAQGGGIVISGLADGVDQAALRGALKTGHATVAVVGCGLDIDYPKSARNLRKDVEANGAIISEYPPGTPALPNNFPPRNRIISGLSLGVVVVEAPMKSGALITARTAYEQDRDVFVHPGTVEDAINSGNYLLMRDGAKPVRTGADILTEYLHLYPRKIDIEKATGKKPSFFKKNKPNEKDVPEIILSVLSDDQVMHVDEIITKTKLSASDVLSNLTIMEITGAVAQLPGKRFKREPGW